MVPDWANAVTDQRQIPAIKIDRQSQRRAIEMYVQQLKIGRLGSAANIQGICDNRVITTFSFY